MTLDEIIECIKEVKEDYWEDDGYGYATADCQRITTALDEVIERLEQTEWIPISERLPEFSQDVLLSLRNLDIVTGFRAETEPYFYCRGVDGCYVDPQNVLAWMPLPEPYESQESEG